MKKPWLAFLLSFLLVGAGLAYLGKWGWAAINFFGVIAAGVIINRYSPDSLSWVGPAMAASSGSIAMTVARTMNQQVQLLAAGPRP